MGRGYDYLQGHREKRCAAQRAVYLEQFVHDEGAITPIVGEAARNAPGNASKEARTFEITVAKSKHFAHPVCRQQKMMRYAARSAKNDLIHASLMLKANYYWLAFRSFQRNH